MSFSKVNKAYLYWDEVDRVRFVKQFQTTKNTKPVELRGPLRVPEVLEGYMTGERHRKNVELISASRKFFV